MDQGGSPAVICDGAVMVALVPVGVAAVVVAVGVFWIELDRCVVVGDGAVGVTLTPVGGAAVDIGPGRPWIAANDLGTRHYSSIKGRVVRLALRPRICQR